MDFHSPPDWLVQRRLQKVFWALLTMAQNQTCKTITSCFGLSFYSEYSLTDLGSFLYLF